MDSLASRGRPVVASTRSGSGSVSGAVDGDGVAVGAGVGADGRACVGVDAVRSGSASACPEHPATSASATIVPAARPLMPCDGSATPR